MAREPEKNEPSRRKPLFGGFRARILAAMTLAALAPLLVMAYQGYHCARVAIVAQQENHLRGVLAGRRARLADWLGERQKDLAFLATTPCTRDSCTAFKEDASGPECACRILDTFRNLSDSYEVIASFDPGWNLIEESRRRGCKMEIAPGNAFKARLAEAKDLVVAPPCLFCTGMICLDMGHPLFDAAGGRAGYLVTCMNLSRAIDPILQDRTALGKTGKVFLVSPEGKIQSRPRAGEDLLGTSSGIPHEALAALREEGAAAGKPSPPSIDVFEYRDHIGNPVIGAVTGFPGMPFAIVAEIDRAEAFAPLQILKIRALATGLITLVLVLLFSFWIAGRLSFPLRELAAVARRISAGRHGDRLGPMKETEAREVAEAFNRMLDELTAAQRRLSHAAALAAIGELSTSVVHEIRNPLSSIKVNLQALQRKVEGDEAHAELARIAAKQVQRVERMLEDLLNFGKPLEIHPAPAAFGDLVKDVLDVAGEKARAAGVEIEVRDRTGGIPVIADREQMQRALTNLVTNAVAAAGEGAGAQGGGSTKSTLGETREEGETAGKGSGPSRGRGRVVITGRFEKEGNGDFVLTVADDGPGIPEAIAKKLFKPFVTTRDEGTGLGLANVKKIAEYHGGSVFAENRRPGAAVTIRIPPRFATGS